MIDNQRIAVKTSMYKQSKSVLERLEFISFPDSFSSLLTRARHTSGKIHFDLISD